jgi:hypothetical protein
LAIDSALKVFFTETVTIESFSSSDTGGYVVPSYSTGVSYSAKIEGNDEMVRDEDGNENRSRRKVFLFTQDVITSKDRITLPAGYTPLQPQILAVRTATDHRGVNHRVVLT